MNGVPSDRGLEPVIRLPGRHPKRSAHELEILHADRDGQPFEPANAEFDRVLRPVLARASLSRSA